MNDENAYTLRRVKKILAPLKLYTVEEVLGSGAMGSVVLVRHKVLGRRAMKLVSPSLLNSKTLRLRFENEARIMNELNHPNVVRVFEMGEVGEDPDEYPYIVMEYLEGGSLADHLDKFGAMPARQAVQVAILILRGLQTAHDLGVVHRDIKPQNVLFDLKESVKVADFGIARIAGTDAKRLTNDGNAIGTMSYMAFEQLDGALDIDGRADQYAVGVTLFEMLLNFQLEFEPFFTQLARKSHWWNEVPEVLKGVLKKATAINPNDRFESAETMARVLEACLAELPEDSIVTQKLGSASSHKKTLQKRLLSFEGTINDNAEVISGWDDVHIFPESDSVIEQISESDIRQDEEEIWEYHPPSDDVQIHHESLEISAEEVADEVAQEEIPLQQTIIEVPLSAATRHRLVWIVCVTILVCAVVLALGSMWFQRSSQQERVLHHPALVESDVSQQTVETDVPIIHETPSSEVPVPVTTSIPVPVKKLKIAKSVENIQASTVSTPPPAAPEVLHPESVLPESQVRVLLKPDTTAKVTLSGEKGVFVITGGVLAIPEGIYQVSVDLPGRLQPQTGSLTIRSGMTTITCDARFKMCTGLK